MGDLDVKEPQTINKDPNRRCADYDDDCADIPCKVHCWLYDPERGICPYLI